MIHQMMDKKTKLIVFLLLMRIPFGVWMGGFVVYAEIPLTAIVLYGVMRKTWWGYLFATVLFSIMVIIFLEITTRACFFLSGLRDLVFR